MSIFDPASFRRFLHDVTRGPDDLIVRADDLMAIADAVGVTSDEIEAEECRIYHELMCQIVEQSAAQRGDRLEGDWRLWAMSMHPSGGTS